MKKLLAILLAVSLLFISCAGKVQDQDIVILYTNDVHCGVDDNIGYAKLASYKKQLLEQNPYVTLVDAGDAVQGDIIGALSKGEDIIRILNMTGYDMAIPGNHEFDYGMKQFTKLSKMLDCGYIASNFRDLKTGKLVFPPYKIIKYGKKKVAYVSVTTPETLIQVSVATFHDADGKQTYSFDWDELGQTMYQDVQTAIDQVRREGADYVIILSHLGEKMNNRDEWTSKALVANIQGADLLIDGHTHSVIPALIVKDKTGKEVTITQTGTKLAHLGKATIHPSGEITVELLDSVDAEPDPKVTALIADIRKQHEEILNAQLGTMDFPLLAKNKDGSWIVRSKESNLADFVSDAFRTTLNADIGLVNGGGLRNNMAAGTICYKDALSVLPFGNIMCGAEVSGKTILDELEFGVRDLPANSGEFLHVSGLTYTLDTSIPSSTKTDASGLFSGVTGPYRISDVKVNGVPLDPEKKYLVAGLDFFLKNKGGGHNFADARFLPIENITDCEVLVEYVKKLGKVPAEYSDPAGQGRIKFKN